MEKKKYKKWAGLSGQFQVKFDGNLHMKMDENACKNEAFWAIGMITKYRVFRIGFGVNVLWN